MNIDPLATTAKPHLLFIGCGIAINASLYLFHAIECDYLSCQGVLDPCFNAGLAVFKLVKAFRFLARSTLFNVVFFLLMVVCLDFVDLDYTLIKV